MSKRGDGGSFTRRLLSVGAIAGVVIIGNAGTALAVSGNGNAGQGHSASAPGQVKKQGGSQTAPSSSSGPSSSASDHSQGNAGTSGDPSQPQPVSNADQNGGGANGQCPGGPYCSTRDGSPSGNGNGNGKATGKPCAGCVGKADNKNPKGQMPNGSDHNAGYECDRNHGIGRTNPAHTGCTSSNPPPCTGSACQPCDHETCPPPPPCSGAECQPCDHASCPPPPPCTGSDCQPCDHASCPPPCQSGMTGEKCSPPPECVPTKANHFCSNVKAVHHRIVTEVLQRPPTNGSLPFTGAPSGMLLESGLSLLAIGSLTVMLGRRRKVKA